MMTETDNSQDREPDRPLSDVLDSLLKLVIRRRWWIITPAFAIILATALVLSHLPNRYTSEARLMVVRQQVPERYVIPTVNTDISQALEAMTHDVLSRTRLMGIINDLNLYQKERSRLAPEQLVALMRRDVSILPMQSNPQHREVNAFQITFTANHPRLAQQVTGRLTNLFIEQNLQTRAEQATTTTAFLREQLEIARTKLLEHEERLRDYKMQHLGQLPEQQQGNLTILAGLQAHRDSLTVSLERAKQQRVTYETLLNGYRSTAERDLARLESEREQLLAKYTPLHAAVVKKDEEIAHQRSIVESLSDGGAPSAGRRASPGLGIPASERNAIMLQLKAQLEATRMEIDTLSKTEEKVKAEIERYQSRLNLTAVREQQLTSMLRDYDLLKRSYADLLHKEMESQLATSLEKRQEGQQFRVVDPPNLPAVPSSPKRVKINVVAAAAGVGFGLAVAFLIDMRHRCFHSEKSLKQHVPTAWVLGVPLLRTPVETRALRRKLKLEWVAGIVMLLVACAAELYVYRGA
jgi:polysaccharide chain length determinant protein (PEP-CTERM system associated)